MVSAGRMMLGNDEDREDSSVKLAHLNFAFSADATMTAADLEACLWGASYLLARLHGTSPASANSNTHSSCDISDTKY